MSYLVTGATGFVGRFLVRELLERREGDIYVLVRPGSTHKLEHLRRFWGDSSRVVAVEGDLREERLGLSTQWITAHKEDIDHVFHLAAIYDMTADEETNQALNVEGTRAALELAEALQAGCFHHMSSVAVAGDYAGMFDETMFDEGQRLPSAYHRTKFDSEQLVREQTSVPWRVYRPSVVVGHSETGEIDKVDGPYYFFPLLKRLRDTLPGWTPLVGLDLGDTNVVPVDYVASATDHLAHQPGLDRQAFHLVNPEPQGTVELVNLFAQAAKGPTFATPVDRRLTALPAGVVPSALKPGRLARRVLGTAPVHLALKATIGRLGVPPEVLGHASFPGIFASSRTEKNLGGSGISVPDIEGYADALWTYWEEYVDDAIARDKKIVSELQGKTVLITGASSGIGLVTALKVAKAGGVPLLVARGKDKLEDLRLEIESRGGTAYTYPCDLSDFDSIDALCQQVSEEQRSVDFVVNNAGRSIRRSLKLSQDRFHDFERTMQLNYFGAIRLVMGLVPKMQEQRRGHVVNISSIGVQTNPPRFSAYVASKSALDSWSNVVSSELVGDGISFTTIHMPLVRTPMIAPTKIYQKFPTISPSQAADLVVKAMVERPHQINTAMGNFGAVANTVSPKLTFRILHLAYQVFPDSAAARGDKDDPTNEQMFLARVLKGVHW